MSSRRYASPNARHAVAALTDRYRGLALRPTRTGGSLFIAGDLEFTASGPNGERPVSDTFAVTIFVPPAFPADPPTVRETGGRLPRTFHTYQDGALCLGSPLRLRMRLRIRPDLLGFVETCLIPYLYGYLRFQQGEPLPFGELDHGDPGLLDEYQLLLCARDDRTCIALISMLGVKKRVANKWPCPCGAAGESAGVTTERSTGFALLLQGLGIGHRQHR